MKAQGRIGGLVLFGVVAVMIFRAAGVASPQQSLPPDVQAAMRGIFVTLSSVYAYSLDADAFDDPANRQEILTKLEALARNAGELKAHGSGLDPSFDFMKRSLSRDAYDALAYFKQHNYVGSRFVLGKITENCVSCHTKAAAGRQFDLGKKFLESIDTADLTTAARANLQVATRQFSDAMKTYEEVLRSPDVTPDDLETFDVFENYLRISIGAMNDTKRPAQTLEKFANRPGVPDALKAEVRAWIGSLETLMLDAPEGKELAAARHMVAEARSRTKARSDRSRLVDYIGSITLLHRYLRSAPAGGEDVAEAYYLLGVAESHVAHSYWVSETDYLLEQSIRTAPKSAVAKEALAFLEDYRRSAVTPARAVPRELQTDIEELRKLTGQ